MFDYVTLTKSFGWTGESLSYRNKTLTLDALELALINFRT
mgnify:CR=1 FL=1